MPAVNRSAIIKQSTLIVRDLLLNSITDPLTGRSGNSKFIATAWPERDVQYPVITVEQQGYSTVPAGTSSNETIATIGFEINVWSRSTRERDELTGSVIAVIEQNQTVTQASGLFDMDFINITSIDEEGKAGVHRKVIELNYLYPTQ